MDRRNRTKRRIARFGALGVVLILLLAALLIFRVKKVDVYGNTRHSAEEIAAGLSDSALARNTLYLAWRYREGDIPDTLPFLNSLHVQMKSPSRLELQVSEKEPVAYIENNGYVYIDSSGLVLEITDEVYGELPLVTGVTVGEVTLYQKLPTESSSQLETIRSIVQLLADQQLSAAEIRFSENMEITVFIQGIEVQMGQNEYLPEKVANLSKILPRLEGQKGVLHLEGFTGGNEAATFSPSGEDGASQSVTGGTVSDEGGSEDGSGAEDAGTGDTADGGTATADGADEEGGSGAQDAEGAGDGGPQDAEGAGDGGSQDTAGEEDNAGEDSGSSSSTIPMVFDSSGTLIYNVHIENGVVVDSYGTPVAGVTVNEDGNVVDAYMNVIDPATGELVQ